MRLVLVKRYYVERLPYGKRVWEEFQTFKTKWAALQLMKEMKEDGDYVRLIEGEEFA